jgi:hypothetical protein
LYIKTFNVVEMTGSLKERLESITGDVTGSLKKRMGELWEM